jgi:hypothetical protein
MPVLTLKSRFKAVTVFWIRIRLEPDPKVPVVEIAEVAGKTDRH